MSYISEVPIWKSTYRLVLPTRAGDKPLLQGWAIVDNTIGEDDMVLPGWEPLKLKGDTAQVTLRTYKIGPSGLPAEVTSREKPLLTGPLELTIGERKLNWTRKLEGSSDTKATWNATAKEAAAGKRGSGITHIRLVYR